MILRHAAAACLLLAGTAWAATPEPGTLLGTDLAKISAALQADGYKILEFRKHPAITRVTVKKDGARHDIRLSTRTGHVVAVRSYPPASAPEVAGPLEPTPMPQSSGWSPENATGSSATAAKASAGAHLDDAALRARLIAEGYQVLSLEREGRTTEAYARRDGKLWELDVESSTGKILKAEIED